MRAKTPIAMALAALVVAGCGGGTTKTITQVDSTPAPTGTTETTPDIPPVKSPAGSTPAQAPATGGTLAGAEAKVGAQGFNVDDPNDYQPSHTLRVLVGTRKGSGDGYAKRAFFFVGGRYIGTDTADDSAGIRVNRQEDSTVTLAYPLYKQNDPLCCPTGGEALVRYQWSGSRLTPLDPIPSSSGTAPLSRQ